MNMGSCLIEKIINLNWVKVGRKYKKLPAIS